MAIINVEDIQIGMVLANDVKARNGRILIKSGSTINEKMLQTFKAWGITEADIKGVTKDDLAAFAAQKANPRLLQRAEKIASQLFVHADSKHPFMAELNRICVFRILKKLEDGVIR